MAEQRTGELVSARFSQALAARFDAFARRHDVPLNAIVREALDRHLAPARPTLWQSAVQIFDRKPATR